MKEAREIFRQNMNGELDLPFSTEKEGWKKLARKQRNLDRFKESGLDIDSIEPEIHRNQE